MTTIKGPVFKKTAIEGLYVIKRPTYHDNRGFFREVLRVNELEKATGFKFRFKQWSHSVSNPRAIRALHTEDQNKIVYPITGSCFSAYVDVRPDSKTFGKVITKTFKEPNFDAMLIPAGVANSICVIGNKPVHYLYLIDDYYHPKKIRGIAWDDPDLKIRWPFKRPIISDRDRNNPTMREIYPEKYRHKMKKVYVTGSAGLVGSRFVELYTNKYNFLTPEIAKLNILRKERLGQFFNREKPDVVIHFAAFTDVGGAENQRGKRDGSCWKVNVEGAKNIAEMCRKYGVKLIHISTDMVFPGSRENPGPYSERQKPERHSKKLTWYGFTKAKGEEQVRKILGKKAAILRLIYPVRAKYKAKLDYLRKPLELFDKGKLYPMFADQQVSVAFIDEVCFAIEKIIEDSKRGTFHASSKNTGTPYSIASYLIEKARGKKNVVNKSSLDKFLESVDNPVRYPKYGGLRVKRTEKILGMKFSNWKNIIDQLIDQGVS
jgi:dTDP-4-dehydrorhamnose reductase/dTDP-4-dehydrorhamnose 3,5-epimerase